MRFNYNGKYLLTVGGNDKAIFQWKIDTSNLVDHDDEYEYEDELDEDGNPIEKEELYD